MPHFALCAGLARDPFILLLFVKSRVEHKTRGKKGMLRVLQTALPGHKRDAVMNNKQNKLSIFAFYEDCGHNLKIRSIRL
jgi:hypothetical protein